MTDQPVHLRRPLVPLTQAQRDQAGELLHELSVEVHKVGLRPAPSPRHHGHCIWILESRNPSWYRKWCAESTRSRRRPRRGRHHDTNLRRYLVEAALQRMMDGRCTMTVYEERLLRIINGRL